MGVRGIVTCRGGERAVLVGFVLVFILLSIWKHLSFLFLFFGNYAHFKKRRQRPTDGQRDGDTRVRAPP